MALHLPVALSDRNNGIFASCGSSFLKKKKKDREIQTVVVIPFHDGFAIGFN